MIESDQSDVISLVEKSFIDRQIVPTSVSVRRFPGETIVIVEVKPSDFSLALDLASSIDSAIPDGFITIRKGSEGNEGVKAGRVQSLVDPRVNDLIEILNARSRTSEHQPSLHYIPDAAQSLNIATSRRHHLVFGRRGVGKTALLLEAKKIVESKGANVFWINIQTMRSLSAYEAFLSTAARLCDLPESIHLNRIKPPLSVQRASALKEKITKLLGAQQLDAHHVDLLLPEFQHLLQILGQETQGDFYVFLDDFHYLSLTEQPKFLDLIHSISRDTPTWIKAAGIRHQSRWFSDNPPVGLQTGHDAAIINLDITLEQPAKAKAFLSNILESYAREVNVSSVNAISKSALDRLVLASGGVPRDFMVLGSLAIQVARERSNAKTAQVRDVNEAAGRNTQPKLQELEDDAASSVGSASASMSALTHIRAFLLDERQTTYFRVDFRDKETHQKEYDLLQSLMDLRLLHLINSSVSDERLAGHRSEVYMLDLSQFASSRFKRNIRVLDFHNNHLVLKSTGSGSEVRPGDTPNKLLGILRRGPAFDLSAFTPYVAQNLRQ
jgi:AAA ATPase-like protein